MVFKLLRFGFAASSFLLGGILSAQNPAVNVGVISGIVRSGEGAPVPFASIALRRSTDTLLVAGKMTDSSGAFRIVGVAPGSYRVDVRRLGYRMATRSGVTITASAERVDLGVIRLTPIPTALESVVVSADRSPIAILPDRNVYSVDEMPVAAGGTATEVLRTVPELEVSVEGSVTTRGATPRIHINGRPAPMQGEALERYLQQLPAERIDRVEVISNPSARYEAAGQGGIVNIVLKRGTGLGLSGNVAASAGTRSQRTGSGSVNYQTGRLSLFGSASATFFGNRSRNSDLRQNLNVQPTTYLRQDSHSRSSGGMTSASLAAELQVGSGGVLWADVDAGRSPSRTEALVAYTQLDQSGNPVERYDRDNDAELRGLFGSLAAGYRNAPAAGDGEWSVELRRNVNGIDNTSGSARQRLAPDGAALDLDPETTLAGDAQEESDLSVEANLARTWGESGQVEAGYRGAGRDTRDDFRMQVDAPGSGASEVDEMVGEFRYREVVHAAFVSASRRIGRFSVQAGLRGEQTATRTSLPLERETFEARYRSLFPSANVTAEVGARVQLRLSYSKRVERPEAWLLNPNVPVLDPLNLQVGNPYLMPEYTHSLSFTASRTGRTGMLQFSPYYRRTAGSWDQVRTVDDAGVSTVTWQNLATITAFGGRVSASVRQLGPVSGLVSVSGHREVRDASNLREDFSGSSLRFSASSSFTVRATSALNVQGSLTYLPARQLPQGRISPMVFSTLGVRQQLWGRRGAITLSVVDPFELQRFTFTTQDGTHVQTGSSTFSARRVTAGVSYSFGRPPESRRKADAAEEADADDRKGRRIR